MLETQKRDIEGVTYEVRQLDAVRGRRVFVRFAKLVAPLLTAVKNTPKGTTGEAQLAGIVADVFEAISEDDFDFFCESFAGSTCIVEGDRKPELSKCFSLHFAGKYLEMLQWLAFCFEVNFGTFFQKLGPKSDS